MLLEIGFGGGLNLPHLIADAAFVGGVDRSSAMVRRAKLRFQQAVSAGRADFVKVLSRTSLRSRIVR